ncbi:unnamed protein product [Cuscuta campestris]|uniref:Aminotransferase-like plant mobile domain-containing protein n=1 Tax=Cuscuta campestris TaxID=132261 RepID=A0A484KQ00_9ASTE|nr:unnamed protein product [Cuscuta campestris]
MNFQRTEVHLGPIVPDVLVLGPSEHRCDRVWQDREFGDVLVKCVKFFGSLREGFGVERHPRVVDILREYGFYEVERISKLQIDWALITALVERWRPETHAFHLPFGEVGITLQDVDVLLGLPVDGTPVVGSHGNTKEYWAQLCSDMLGFRPSLEDVTKTQIKMNAIVLIRIGDHSPEVDFRQHVRALMLKIMGGALFASTTGNKVNLCLLELLVGTTQEVRSRTIGSAALACLYSNLCRATLSDTAQIGGPLILLQIWAWERIPMCRPQGVLPPEYGRDAPYGARWVCYHRWTVSPSHTIRPYRDQLHNLQEREFVWMSYPDFQHLHPHYTTGFAIWCARVPLISFIYIKQTPSYKNVTFGSAKERHVAKSADRTIPAPGYSHPSK